MKRMIFTAALLIAAGCSSAPGDGSGPPAVTAPGSQPLASYDAKVEELLALMTLDEKIGQMTQVDQEYLKSDDDIEKYHLGSVLSGGNSDPKAGNSLQAWTDMVDRLQARAMKTRLRIPLLFGVDAVHGHNNVLGAVIFPHNIGLGATRNPDLVEEIGRVTAKEVRATGINWDFAPCVAVPRDERWGRTYEGFSEDPELVAQLGAAAVRGLQGKGLGDPLGVLANAKHFAGDGGTLYGTGVIPKPGKPDEKQPMDRGDVRVDEQTLRKIHLPGYVTTLKAGAVTVMPSYSSWNGEKCSGNKYLLTDLLKGEMGFDGFLISDWAAIDELPGDYASDIEQSINAGMDMVMVPDKYQEFFETFKKLAEAGKVPMERIDDAVRRILRVKFAMGLMDPERSQLADRTLWTDFGSDAHREVARRAVRESLVLLKNEAGVLPLKKTARVHVAGASADDLGNQCGGWTIQWQGASGEVTSGGTTILKAIRKAAGDANVTYSADGSGASGADVAVVVVGETPYAEMFGDREDLSLSEADLAAVAEAKKAGIPVVVVLLSGRPMIVGPALESSDAFVAAWLPGTEGDGVADVLFGDYQPTGKLPFTWPRSMDQLPINVGDEPYDPLFELGFGLTY